MSVSTPSSGWRLLRHGSIWIAIGPDYVNDVVSGVGFGPTPEIAVRNLALDRRTRGAPPDVSAFAYAGERKWKDRDGMWCLELHLASAR